jgi:biopolymer transport protein ExbD
MRIRRPWAEEPEVNLIPLIDVLLVVLVFLAVSTTYARFSQIQIELPTANPDPAAQRPGEISLGIGADGRYAIDRAIVPAGDTAVLADRLRSAATRVGGEPVVVINADAQAPHQAVITAMEAARDAGLGRLAFATQKRRPG